MTELHRGNDIMTREADLGGRACEAGARPLVLRRAQGGRTVRLARGAFTIGAGPDNDLVLDDPFVSRSHASFRREGSGIWLHDQGSRNGTWVNDVRVGRCLVGPGARIIMGRSSLFISGPARSGGAGSGQIVGDHPAMDRVLRQIQRLGPRRLPVLILGETGTGKELVAQALHGASPRREEAMEPLNCSAIPAELAESELFGHERGAFTGATGLRPGAFERASGGTLFLDEVGEMPLALQPKLLRVLEDGLVQRVGGDRRVEVDVRVVAATHRDLADDARQGRFRFDLYHRLAVGVLRLPPLRERASDIPLLASYFLDRLQEGGGPGLELDAAALEVLRRHPWPGNVRQLCSALQRAAAEGGPHLGAGDFGFLDEVNAAAGPPPEGYVRFSGRSFSEVRRDVFRLTVERHRGNRTAAAAALGIPKSTFFDQLRAMAREG